MTVQYYGDSLPEDEVKWRRTWVNLRWKIQVFKFRVGTGQVLKTKHYDMVQGELLDGR